MVTALLVLAWGLVITTTLTRSPYELLDRQITCSLSGNLGEVPKERIANTLLFVPRGFVSWVASPRRFWLGLALAAPFVVEASQGLVLALNRDCDAMDVLANLVGVGVGASLAVAVSAVWSRRRAAAHRCRSRAVARLRNRDTHSGRIAV
jgi:glycopeptide antibiotics resistance protein